MTAGSGCATSSSGAAPCLSPIERVILICITGAVMPITVRLKAKTERTVNALAKRRRQTRSDVVREAIERLGAESQPAAGARSAYDDWEDIIGIGRGSVRDPNK